ncbi:MAG: hypothetical protein EXS10_04055 [Phycisphaerales bacterium]|nr:hypothetical protein [Phycisphaerales bacterium]
MLTVDFRSWSAPLLAAMLLSVGANCARADTLIKTPSKDNTLIEQSPGEWSCGMATYFFAGRVGVNGGSTLRRGALRFDLSAIPVGSTVTSVSLRMYCGAAGLTTAQPVALHRGLLDFGEGPSVAFGGGGAFAEPPDSTWNYQFYPTSLWPTPGGSFKPTLSATKNVASVGYYTWTTTAALVSDAQAWVNAPTSNFGWIVICDEGGELQTAKRFDSRESGVATTRPTLTIVYTRIAPPNPSDLDSNGTVNGADLSILLNAWGTTGVGNINGVGTVDAADLAILLNAWS